jgi:hypothetical protein
VPLIGHVHLKALSHPEAFLLGVGGEGPAWILTAASHGTAVPQMRPSQFPHPKEEVA